MNGERERDAIEEMMRKLTMRQRDFILRYLGIHPEQAAGDDEETARRYEPRGYLCPTVAARLAGYSVPEVEGSRLLRSPRVRAVVDALVEERAGDTVDILMRDLDVARGDMGELADAWEEPSVPRMLRAAHARGRSHVIRKVTEHADGSRSVELYDATKARERLGRRARIYEPDQLDPSRLSPILVAISQSSAADLEASAARLGVLEGRRARVLEGRSSATDADTDTDAG